MVFGYKYRRNKRLMIWVICGVTTNPTLIANEGQGFIR